MMSGSKVTMRLVRLMDSLKLRAECATSVPRSPLDIVRSRVTFKDAVVLFRSMALQPKVPLMPSADGTVAIIGHTTMLVEVEIPIGEQDWRKEIEAERS